MKWSEISNEPQTKRFEALSQELKLSKFENEFVLPVLPAEFLVEKFFENEENCDIFRNYLKQIKIDFDQLRIGGFFKEKIDLMSTEYPADLMQTKTFDSLVKTGKRWWPRSQLFHAFIHLLTNEIKQVDFSSPILIVGANSDSKTIISALIKMGFSRFNVTDSDSELCHMLVQEMKRSYFSTRFEMTEIGYITQLPNIYSMGVNTISGELDETTKLALVYFNFLPKGALWIESCPQAVSTLANEALSFGFQVKLGLDLISELDFTWAKAVLNCEIDVARYKETLKTIYS